MWKHPVCSIQDVMAGDNRLSIRLSCAIARVVHYRGTLTPKCMHSGSRKWLPKTRLGKRTSADIEHAPFRRRMWQPRALWFMKAFPWGGVSLPYRTTTSPSPCVFSSRHFAAAQKAGKRRTATFLQRQVLQQCRVRLRV